MDPHVKRMAQVLALAQQETDGELYDSLTFDDEGNPVESCPALKAQVDGRLVNILLFDVPGSRDHFSIIVNAEPEFIMSLREEVRWDVVLKTLKRVEDHVIGVPDFDRKYLIGGHPAPRVVGFLKRADVRATIKSLEPFLSLACDDGFVRASFPLTPGTHYELKDLRDRVVAMKRLAEAAEGVQASQA